MNWGRNNYGHYSCPVAQGCDGNVQDFLSIVFVIKCLYNKFDIPVNRRHTEVLSSMARSNAACSSEVWKSSKIKHLGGSGGDLS